MNQDTRRKLGRYGRIITFHLSTALASHLDEQYSTARNHVDSAVEVALLAVALLSREYIRIGANSDVKVSNDAKDASS